MGKQKYSEDQCRQAFSLKQSGMDINGIAERIGCSSSSVQHLINRGKWFDNHDRLISEKWWYGLKEETGKELEYRGYESKEDAMLFVSEPVEFVGGIRGHRTPFDPIDKDRNLGLGGGRRISLEVFNEVRVWLGFDPVEPPPPTMDKKSVDRMIRTLEALGYKVHKN